MFRLVEHNFASSVGGPEILGLPSERNTHSGKADAELTLHYHPQLEPRSPFPRGSHLHSINILCHPAVLNRLKEKKYTDLVLSCWNFSPPPPRKVYEKAPCITSCFPCSGLTHTVCCWFSQPCGFTHIPHCDTELSPALGGGHQWNWVSS